MVKFRTYTDEECANMIRTGEYPVDAPRFVILEIRKRRKTFNRKTKSPDKEMEDFMKELGAQKPIGKDYGL